MISKEPASGKRLSEKINYTPAEISVMKRYEFICDSDDLLRRRTLIGQTVSQSDLESDVGFRVLIEHLNH